MSMPGRYCDDSGDRIGRRKQDRRRSGADSLSRAGGNDTIQSGAGNNSLLRSAGDNRITFDGLDAWIKGDAGTDRFTFDAVAITGGSARLLNFSSPGDKIDLAGLDAIAGGADNAFAFIATAAFGNVAGQLRYAATSGGLTVQGDLDGHGVADFSFFVSRGSLSANDFLL